MLAFLKITNQDRRFLRKVFRNPIAPTAIRRSTALEVGRPMQFQKAHVSIVRSIRHVSLVRDWHRCRGHNALPKFATFVPNERAGDAADLLISEVRRDGDKLTYRCVAAGPRVEQVYDETMPSRFLHQCLDDVMAAGVRPVWNACIVNRLPMYSIVPVTDRDGVPVTIEQIFLPYSRDGSNADIMVAALHACSTESRFVRRGLLRRIVKAPLHWAVMIDPAMTVPQPVTQDAGADGIVFNDV